MMRHPHGQTIAVRRVPIDDRGRPTGDPAVVFEVDGCAVERTSTREQSLGLGGQPSDDQRDTVVTEMTVYTPPDVGLWHTDKVWLPGEDRATRPMWRMTSQPWQARNPFTGSYPGDVIELERVDG